MAPEEADYIEVYPTGGWYVCPDDPTRQQYWTGAEWTGKRRRDIASAKPFVVERRPRAPKPSRVPATPPAPEKQPKTTKACPDCGEDVRPSAKVCLFCGHRFDGWPGRPPAPHEVATSWVAVVAFLCSLLGVLWIAAIPLGIHARRRIGASNGYLVGRGFATAAVWLGVLGLIATALFVVALAGAFDDVSTL